MPTQNFIKAQIHHSTGKTQVSGTIEPRILAVSHYEHKSSHKTQIHDHFTMVVNESYGCKCKSILSNGRREGGVARKCQKKSQNAITCPWDTATDHKWEMLVKCQKYNYVTTGVIWHS